jgi:enoyl-CoA hydratase/carnithine racemase
MFRFHIDDRVLHLVIDRPNKRNALDPSQLAAAQAQLIERAADPTLCALQVSGAGSFFCAGYDLDSIPTEPAEDGRMVGELDDFIAALASVSLPSIAVVQGGAYGAGFELALACDMRLTTKPARWCMPPAKLGLLYSLDGMCRLQRAIGEQRARYLLTTAAVINGEQAAEWGLVLSAAADNQALADNSATLLEQLRSINPASARGAKALLHSAERTVPASLIAEAELLRSQLFADKANASVSASTHPKIDRR